jgi:hypothetical protein
MGIFKQNFRLCWGVIYGVKATGAGFVPVKTHGEGALLQINLSRVINLFYAYTAPHRLNVAHPHPLGATLGVLTSPLRGLSSGDGK